MEIPFSTDTTPIALVSAAGVTLDIPANLWGVALAMARALGGWKPAGTGPPTGWAGEGPWGGEYEPAAGQVVGAADAAELAASLRRVGASMEAIARIPSSEREAAVAESLSPESVARVGPILEMYGPGRNVGQDFGLHLMLEEWVEFFSKGAFSIGRAA
jgi:hypothetical protein